jgi:nucleotide-binding universal stress UspA family protein
MTVIVGHDGTDSGDDAAALGARLARATGENLLVVTIYPEENPIGTIGRVDAEWVAAMRDHAREVSDGAKRFLSEHGVEASYRVAGSGSAAHGLDDVAEAEHATMIVVGSERHGARRRISPGSTGERLLHGAICPVAVAPRGFREQPVDAPVQRIAVAFVDTPEGHEAVKVAGELAAETGATVTLYTVVARGAEIVMPLVGRDAEDAFLATVREGARAALDKARATFPDGVQVAEELLEGDTVEALAALDQHEADVLVCGSRGYGPVRRVLLGGVLRRLIRRAACPVVVVPRGAA